MKVLSLKIKLPFPACNNLTPTKYKKKNYCALFLSTVIRFLLKHKM